MRDTATRERFIELRASGLSYDAIAAELNVSKPTLITWSKELAKEVHNARTLRMDELFERFAVAKSKRVETFGTMLNGILAELANRDLSTVSTEGLLRLAVRYGESMRDEYEPLLMQGEEDFGMSLNSTPETWPV